MSTLPSSSGWRSASSAARENSASSSRNSTPRWASVTSPGRGRAPPPTRPCGEMVWWGERNGRSRASSPAPSPATLCTRVMSRASAKSGGGRMPGTRRASIVLPAPGGPTMSRLCPPAAAISSARFASCWPRTSARSGATGAGLGSRRRAVTGSGLQRPCRRSTSAPRSPTGSTSRPSASAASAAFGLGHDHPRVAGCPRRERAGEHSPDRSQGSAQGQLTADGDVRERLRGHLTPGHQNRHRQRQVEAGSGLSHGRGREVRRDPLERELEAGVQHRRADPLSRLAHRRVGQSDHGEGGQPAAYVDFDGDLPAVDPLEGECGDAREHTAKLGGRALPVGHERDDAAPVPGADRNRIVTYVTHVSRTAS